MFPRLAVWLTFLSILPGCAMFSSSIEESKTDSILRHYVADLKYTEDRKTVAKYISQEILRSYEWHEKQDPLIKMDRALGGSRQVEIFGHADDVKAVREAFSRAFRISVRYPEDEDRTHVKGGPVEFSSMREIYILTADSRVSIWNSGDRTRLYHRELELYEHVHPQKAKVIKEAILKDHPGIDFHPWDE